eukprot:2421629-Pyramimonas_sp.AAC.1
MRRRRRTAFAVTANIALHGAPTPRKGGQARLNRSGRVKTSDAWVGGGCGERIRVHALAFRAPGCDPVDTRSHGHTPRGASAKERP